MSKINLVDINKFSNEDYLTQKDLSKVNFVFAAVWAREAHARRLNTSNFKVTDLTNEKDLSIGQRKIVELSVGILAAMPYESKRKSQSIFVDQCEFVSVPYNFFNGFSVEPAREILIMTTRQAGNLLGECFKRFNFTINDGMDVIKDYDTAWSLPVGKNKDIILKPSAQNSYRDELMVRACSMLRRA